MTAPKHWKSVVVLFVVWVYCSSAVSRYGQLITMLREEVVSWRKKRGSEPSTKAFWAGAGKGLGFPLLHKKENAIVRLSHVSTLPPC
ncbi:hypothetical protein QBC35DRAFT_489089 [Podospora australis]|uniref:Secreted protein n=1 Tax=Podospora australis TaxID=1536484 RepID=A0AAN6X2E1_9PEZI|nr:hypothetical protein QBC35DRAFT_489089 [Podospora australis]